MNLSEYRAIKDYSYIEILIGDTYMKLDTTNSIRINAQLDSPKATLSGDYGLVSLSKFSGQLASGNVIFLTITVTAENGVTNEGITDGSITNDKISDNADIDGAKLNINSVVNKINEDGTESIQGTKIEVDGTTLNTKF